MHPKKNTHNARKGRPNKNGDGDALCGRYIHSHRKLMAYYDVSVYKGCIGAFSELTLCFVCWKQARLKKCCARYQKVREVKLLMGVSPKTITNSFLSNNCRRGGDS